MVSSYRNQRWLSTGIPSKSLRKCWNMCLERRMNQGNKTVKGEKQRRDLRANGNIEMKGPYGRSRYRRRNLTNLTNPNTKSLADHAPIYKTSGHLSLPPLLSYTVASELLLGSASHVFQRGVSILASGTYHVAVILSHASGAKLQIVSSSRAACATDEPSLLVRLLHRRICFAPSLIPRTTIISTTLE